uniref:Uncharacterized protein n=1 Tax=Zea mays TaxID=4577 RepID=C4J8N4_MAIZE|nr:unknown [Zea mays]
MPCQPALEQYVCMTQQASPRVLLLSMMRAMHCPVSASLQESTRPPPACEGGEVLLTSRQEATERSRRQQQWRHQPPSERSSNPQFSLHLCIFPDGPPPPAAYATRQGLNAEDDPPG